MVEELGLANGTFINGRRMVGATLLKPGDELRIDVVRFLLIVPGKEAEHLTAAADAVENLDVGAGGSGDGRAAAVALFALGWSFLS